MSQNTHDLTANKLIILFLLKNVPGAITQTQITDFILYHNYTDYFSLQQYMAELINASLIHQEKKDNMTLYKIAERGLDTLSLFSNRIPFSIREEIIEYTKNNHCKINLFTKLDAVIKEDDDAFIVSCSMKENDKAILSLDIRTDSEDEAKSIKVNWQKKARSIYKTIVEDLKSQT